MDFLDILIYIVFGAIGIFSSINNSKAKKRAENKQKTQPKPGNSVTPVEDVVEEDVALCEFVDPSKTEIQQLVRDGINLMIKEC